MADLIHCTQTSWRWLHIPSSGFILWYDRHYISICIVHFEIVSVTA